MAELRAFRQEVGRHPQRVALVPTMGALHQGHLALVKAAWDRCEQVIVSIFVNPMQFGPHEDYGRYPRTLDHDMELLSAYPGTVVFTPSVEEMYPTGPSWTIVSIPRMTGTMCGLHRPGHFEGVCTVVAKLFNIIQPDMAFFGQKDGQQLAIIRKMAADLNFPVEIVAVPTVREPSGLALSSRNQYLDSEDLRRAPRLYQALRQARDRFEQGERTGSVLLDVVHNVLADADITPEYIALVDYHTLEPVE
ncbi:MAG: pantoate--beta-alanine ligase, partial [Sulfobacillus thermosulfidooxidans]